MHWFYSLFQNLLKIEFSYKSTINQMALINGHESMIGVRINCANTEKNRLSDMMIIIITWPEFATTATAPTPLKCTNQSIDLTVFALTTLKTALP